MSGKVLKEHSVTVHLIDAVLPENDLIYTNWFHYDALSDITHIPVWSDAFFVLLEKYLRNSVKNGMNTLLFPTFTETFIRSIQRAISYIFSRYFTSSVIFG